MEKIYKYRAKVNRDGVVTEEIIETTETLDRLLAHAHIHSATPITGVVEEKEEKVEAKVEAKKK